MNLKNLSKRYPARIALLLVGLTFIVRLLDVFVLRSDELFGEQYLTKLFGLVLVFAYVWYIQGSLASIGLHGQHWKTSVLLGLAVMGAGLLVGYGLEYLLLSTQGKLPVLLFSPQGMSLVPGEAATGGFWLTVSLLVGNLVNSFMEESLFRGIMLTHLGTRMQVWKANLVQAGIFGVWHIVWPIRDYLDGKMDAANMVILSVGYILLSGLIGYAWGYFYQKTNSLWASWAAHTLNNTTMNLVHITTAAGDPGTMPIRVAVVTLVVALLLPLVRKTAAAKHLPEIKRWDTPA